MYLTSRLFLLVPLLHPFCAVAAIGICLSGCRILFLCMSGKLLNPRNSIRPSKVIELLCKLESNFLPERVTETLGTYQ